MLLTIGQASKILGVSEVTLRQWTDEGKIKAFVAPGGHRRYYESELREFMGPERRVHGIKDVVAQMELAPAIESEIAHTHFADTVWYSKLDQDSKAKLADLGRRLHRLAIMYISKQRKQDETMQLAKEAGQEFGAYLAEIGLSLTDAIEAFLLHRSPLVNAVTALVKKRESMNERAAEALPLITQITDAVLLALVEAYQSHSTHRK